MMADEMTPLCHMANKYVTDKYSIHRYTPVYFKMFEPIRHKPIVLLEIGIGRDKGPPANPTMRRAASLYMWEEFFPNAKIIGLDSDKVILINRDRISSYYANQNDPKTLVAAVTAAGKPEVDILIDDGSHDPGNQISSCLTLMPFVKPGGVYIIEDIRADANTFTELRKHFVCEHLHTNPDVGSSRLCIITKPST
jgi:hypothetical protein